MRTRAHFLTVSYPLETPSWSTNQPLREAERTTLLHLSIRALHAYYTVM